MPALLGAADMLSPNLLADEARCAHNRARAKSWESKAAVQSTQLAWPPPPFEVPRQLTTAEWDRKNAAKAQAKLRLVATLAKRQLLECPTVPSLPIGSSVDAHAQDPGESPVSVAAACLRSRCSARLQASATKKDLSSQFCPSQQEL